jgi:hypothetical protein
MAAKAMGQSPAGLVGFSHMLGGYSGGQEHWRQRGAHIDVWRHWGFCVHVRRG